MAKQSNRIEEETPHHVKKKTCTIKLKLKFIFLNFFFSYKKALLYLPSQKSKP